MIYKGDGLFSREYQWNKILSSNDFINALDSNNVDLDETAKENIKDSQFVFTFLVSESSSTTGIGSSVIRYYEAYDVGILRLHFLDTSNKIYNLGVVSDLGNSNGVSSGFSGSLLTDIKDSLSNFFDTILEFIQKIILIISIIGLILILNFVIGLILPGVNIIKFIIKSIGYVISLPFKIIKWIFKKNKPNLKACFLFDL